MTPASVAAGRPSEAVSAKALDRDEQRHSEQDERHDQALSLAVAHVRYDRADHRQREPERGDRQGAGRNAQRARED
jgi:hypothetical protein